MKPSRFFPSVKVWYKPLPRLPTISWPIVDVKVSRMEKSLPQPLLSLIDSGASISILHPEVADILGFDLKKLGTLHGGISVSGFYNAWLLPEPITVEIYGYSFNFSFQVINNRDFIWPCILGENSIFEVAKLDFQKFKGFFEVSFRGDIH